MKYIHKKTGNIYRLLAFATDCTNIRDGENVIVYRLEDNAHDIYVRNAKEFNEKFKIYETDNE